ncbi:MAG: hypothetical protein PHP23_07700 [Desulfobacterales bacterium]|nr:hypothetical protein [Desulfobacterales bacterium]MDD4072702.1 hypothetical protein [Desulfobacterales bacterium]MDD4393125.1 hypothetical protein [Desulfobacterales bacterium]
MIITAATILPEKVSKAWEDWEGLIESHKEGAAFEDMKAWNPEKLPGHAAALKVEAVYAGAGKLL